jgi:hypothetical protein
MKKLIRHALVLASGFFLTVMVISPTGVSAARKAAVGGNPIPASVMKIAKKSCVNCHAEPGNRMAKTKVNLSQWDTYSPEKQAKKAKDMCNMITKGKMPPKKFREKHPEDVPTPAELKTICEWAESLQPAKK